LPAFLRLILPEAFFLKRFFAPLFDFIFGIMKYLCLYNKIINKAKKITIIVYRINYYADKIYPALVKRDPAQSGKAIYDPPLPLGTSIMIIRRPSIFGLVSISLISLNSSAKSIRSSLPRSV